MIEVKIEIDRQTKATVVDTMEDLHGIRGEGRPARWLWVSNLNKEDAQRLVTELTAAIATSS